MSRVQAERVERALRDDLVHAYPHHGDSTITACGIKRALGETNTYWLLSIKLPHCRQCWQVMVNRQPSVYRGISIRGLVLE